MGIFSDAVEEEEKKQRERDAAEAKRLYGYHAPMPVKGGKKYASEMRGWLDRETYEDYKNRFMPHEQELIDSVTSTDMLDKRLSQISISEENAFEGAMAKRDRSLARYGSSVDPRMNRVSETQHSLGRASASASAQNATRQAVHDRNMSLISGAPTRSALSGG